MDTKNIYLQDFARYKNDLPGMELAWLAQLRNSAISSFNQTGFPSGKDEDWRLTSVKPIVETSFKPAIRYERDGLSPESLKPFYVFNNYVPCRLVFINGNFSPEFSSVNQLPDSVQAGSIAGVLLRNPDIIKPYLGKNMYGSCRHAFAALNTAFFSDGAFVYVPRTAAPENPIHLLFVAVPGSKSIVSYPRVLVVLESGAKATIVESYAGLSNTVYFTNAVTEILIGENSVVEHYKLQEEDGNGFHVAAMEVTVGDNSNFVSHSVSFGGALVRNDLNVTLAAEGAECTLNGLYVTAGRQHVDNHTSIVHAAPHTTSRELYKGLLNDSSRAIFNGAIVVEPGAQKTNALQVNKNLLLSEESLVSTKPELRIYANDVKCRHGATIGQLSQDALFYLRSRGLDLKSARETLIYAFANEMLNRMALRAVVARIEKLLGLSSGGIYYA